MSRQERTTERLQRELKRRGFRITVAGFHRLLERALEDFEVALAGPSVSELSAAERAVLEEGGFDLKRRKRKGPGPYERGLADYAVLLQTSLSVVDAARLLEVHPTRIRQRLRAKSLYGFRRDRAWLLPRFQFVGRRALPGLGQVLPAISEGQHALGVAYFFMTPQSDLRRPETDQEMTPRDWLLLGLPPEPVAELAGTLGVA